MATEESSNGHVPPVRQGSNRRGELPPVHSKGEAVAAGNGSVNQSDWLYVGKKVSHRDTSDQWRMHGEVVEVLPFGEFIVKWDRIKRPERMLRYDLR